VTYFLSAEEILKADDLQVREVEVPEWAPDGVEHAVVRVRGLTGTDLDAYQASMVQVGENGQMVPDMSNAQAKLVMRAVVDEAGNPLFNELDVGRLGQKSAIALGRVHAAAQELSGLGAGAVAAAAGNSEAAQSGSSTSS
jgi:hypothetical protein